MFRSRSAKSKNELQRVAPINKKSRIKFIQSTQPVSQEVRVSSASL